MDAATKKKLRDTYKSKPVIGGVCCIRCGGNHRALLQVTTDVESLRNRFNFQISIGTAPDPSMRGEWEKYGSDSFSFAVLEELKKGEDQTRQQFLDDLDVLYEIWKENLKDEI